MSGWFNLFRLSIAQLIMNPLKRFSASLKTRDYPLPLTAGLIKSISLAPAFKPENKDPNLMFINHFNGFYRNTESPISAMAAGFYREDNRAKKVFSIGLDLALSRNTSIAGNIRSNRPSGNGSRAAEQRKPSLPMRDGLLFRFQCPTDISVVLPAFPYWEGLSHASSATGAARIFRMRSTWV